MSKGFRKPVKRIKGKKKSVGSAPGASSSHAAPRTPSMELSARDKAKARVAQIEIYATTAVSFLLLVMACAHWFTDVRQRVATFQWLQGVWDVYEQYASVPRRPSHTSWDSWCDLVHSFTSSCFFLSGATNKSVVADGWEHVRSLWTTSPSSPNTMYRRDPRDVLFATTWGMVFFVVRFVLMQCVLLPLGRLLVSRPTAARDKAHYQAQLQRRIARFGQQAWILILYSASLIFVVRVIQRQPFWIWKPQYFWLDYPATTTDALTKAVYLWEASNYIHQVFVINLEERRSDFWQMLIHHFVTLLLIGGSYACCFHYVGISILFLMDPADICLSIAKLFKYMGFSTFCDVLFTIFMLVWIITRHVGYAFVWWSCFKDAPALISFTNQLDLASGHMLTRTTYVFFLILLTALQAILLIWFSMIVNIAVRVLTQQGAVDTRSDDDSD